MKNRLTFLIGVLVVAVLLVYMFAFQVRYDEVAVVRTFDKAAPPAYKPDGTLARNAEGLLESPGSVIETPGLYPKWPWPIQSVQTFSKRIQILDDPSEEQTTADGYSVIVKTYLAWRIQDPHAFAVSVKTLDEADKRFQPLLREIRGIIGRYRFDQLVNTDAGALKLAQIEQEALEALNQKLAQIQPSFGITVEHVGIRRVVLPERVTESVFARMRATRERLAADARYTGTAKAAAIRSDANSAQRTILSFAQSRADAIRAEGIRQAAASYKVFEQDQAFAIFLAQIESLKKMLAHNTTLVLDAHGPLELFNKEPGTTGAPGSPGSPGILGSPATSANSAGISAAAPKP